ncbi:MAG: alpha/beta hydrolase, partial [Mycobacterium sp.]|nr:alpha/beta hydrolase [Mycobacterium sp.]
MAVSVDGVVTVLLPGTGSDDDYLRRALAGPLRGAGAIVVLAAPEPTRLVEGYLDALDRALERAPAGRIAVGGVSLGAVVAARWALAHPEQTVAVLA